MYEIAQLSRASAAPAKSCTEMERTSKGAAELRGKKRRNGEKNSLCLIVTTFSKSPGKAGCSVSLFTYPPPPHSLSLLCFVSLFLDIILWGKCSFKKTFHCLLLQVIVKVFSSSCKCECSCQRVLRDVILVPDLTIITQSAHNPQ